MIEPTYMWFPLNQIKYSSNYEKITEDTLNLHNFWATEDNSLLELLEQTFLTFKKIFDIFSWPSLIYGF